MPFSRIRVLIAALLTTAMLVPAGTAAASSAAPRSAKRSDVAAASYGKPAAHARATQQPCANADADLAAAGADVVRQAVLCLHNRIRAARGLPQLRENAKLRRAAAGHSEDMVSRRFFEHTTPSGSTMVDRILRARYVTRSEGWSLGENIAWGTGRLATPQGVVQAWMESPGHRANMLKRAYREIGIGVVGGIPTGAAAGATYTADFGVRR